MLLTLRRNARGAAGPSGRPDSTRVEGGWPGTTGLLRLSGTARPRARRSPIADHRSPHIIEEFS